jgi:hypothetical protein
VITTSGCYLAVLPPKARYLASHPPHAVNVSMSDLALVLRHVHASRLGDPHAQPTADPSGDATAAYHRIKAAITRHVSPGSQL